MRVSEALGTTPSKLKSLGIADTFLGIDSRLHIDPALLRTTRVSEFKNSAARFEKYFSTLMVAIANMKGSALRNQLIEKLIFPEVSAAALGVCKASSRGRGVSKALATQVFGTAEALVGIGIKEPEIFELLVLFEPGFGPDLISDMTLWVILDDVSNYNSRVCERLGIRSNTIEIHGRNVTAAHSEKTNTDILLLPMSLLSDLPVATSSKDIDDVAHYNEKVREHLNKWLGRSWSNLYKRLGKGEIRKLLLSNPDMFKELIERYRTHRPQPYDFDVDPLGEVIWDEIGKDFAKEHPLALAKVTSPDDLRKVILKITSQFKQLIEQNQLWRAIYNDNGSQRSEKFSQLLFYSIAISYCKANDLDISVEPNAGRGPVDFKISRGYNARGLVEVKLTSNSKVLSGMFAQLPTYSKAEDVPVSVFLLIVVNKSRLKVDEVTEEEKKLKKAGKHVPDLCIVEAFRAKVAPSASKLQYRLINFDED